MNTIRNLMKFFAALVAALSMCAAMGQQDSGNEPSPDADSGQNPNGSALPGIPSTTTTPYIPAITLPDGTQIGISANIDTTTGPNPILDGGGIGVSTPVTPNTSFGAGVSRTPDGTAVGIGMSINF